ncbi:MAG: MFS transporter [Gammaproteobacteria bacterium]|nr:MFS transporter [Gammaproteobacteria bacterium]
MFNRNQFIISYCTIVAFAILYEHQPLLPLLAQQWGISLSDAALLTTVTMLPLAIAPLIYGYILEQFSARHMLMGGFTLLLLSQAILSTAPDYPIFLVLRAIEGLVLPAIFTSLMTYTSASGGQQHARRNIGVYIAATIVGGYCGRTLTGFVTSLYDWQTAFWMWSFLALVAVLALFRLDSDPRSNLVKPSFAEIKLLMKKPVNREGLLAAFLLFFVFAAMLNFLPFRMLELDPEITTLAISMVYTGYLIGIVISLSASRVIAWFGSERKTLLVAGVVYVAGTWLFMSDSILLLYPAMFIFASGMFTLHSVLSGYLNHLEPARKGMINGLYVSAYYSGGALGSFLPGLVYQSVGWTGFSLVLMALLLVLGAVLWSMPRNDKLAPKTTTPHS